MEFNLISKQDIIFPHVRSLKRKKRVVSATKTHNGRYYPTLEPVIDQKEDEPTDEDEATATDNEKVNQDENSRAREKSIDILFGGDSDLAKELKRRSEVPLTTDLTLTSSNDGRLKIYTKLENPEDKERDLFEGLYKLQESLPPNSLEFILSVKNFQNDDGDDNSVESYDYEDNLRFIEKGLKLKRNEAGSVILEMTDMHFPEDEIWWVKWIHRNAEFYGELSLNVRLDLAAVTELHKRQFKGGPLATEDIAATDMVILVEGNKDKEKGIKCHKSVLSGMSPVFAAMFQADMLEAKGTLEILDFSEAVVRTLIEFAYRGNLEEALKSFKMTLELLKAADKYQMKDLMDVLLHIIWCMPCAWFEVDLAVKLFVFAKNRGKDLDQAEKKGGMVLEWYAEKDPEKLKNSKMWADMCESPGLAMEFVVQLRNTMK